MIHAAALTLTICLLLSMDDNVNKMNIKQELSQAREAVLQRLNDEVPDRSSRALSGILDCRCNNPFDN